MMVVLVSWKMTQVGRSQYEVLETVSLLVLLDWVKILPDFALITFKNQPINLGSQGTVNVFGWIIITWSTIASSTMDHYGCHLDAKNNQTSTAINVKANHHKFVRSLDTWVWIISHFPFYYLCLFCNLFRGKIFRNIKSFNSSLSSIQIRNGACIKKPRTLCIH